MRRARFQPSPALDENAEIRLERWLASQSENDHLLAAQTLATMGTEATTRFLLHLWAQEQRERLRRGRRYGTLWMGVGIGIATAGEAFGLHGVAGGLAGWIVGSSQLIRHGVGPTALQTAVTRRLAALGDVRAVGPLVNALLEPRDTGGAADAARSALIRLLPRLTTGEGDLLSKTQWHQLARLLLVAPHDKKPGENKTNVDLHLAILRAVAVAGSDPATLLPLVDKLARRPASTTNEPRFVQAVENYRAVLAARAKGELRP